MRAVVTGATSFIGSSVVKELQARGHDVYAVVRPASKNLNTLPARRENITVIELEMDRLDRLPELIPGKCEWFFHFAWDGAGSENRKKRTIQQRNVENSLKALRSAKELGVSKFLFSGSQAEYGKGLSPMTESLKCSPTSEYGKAKVDFYRRSVELCQQWVAGGESCPHYIHTRIFSIYGPGDHQGSLIQSCLRAFINNQEISLGSCQQLWNYLHIEDLTQALVALMTSPDGKGTAEIYNVAQRSGETRPLREYIEKIHVLCGGKGSCYYGVRPPNAEGEPDLVPDIGKIIRQTGWKPQVSFEKGIKDMLKSNCLICRQPLDRPLLFLENMPASAQNIPGAGELEQESGISLTLCQCPGCGLVQFDCEPVDYYREVIRSGGFSTTMVELRRRQYQSLIETYQLQGKEFIEIGCGRGEFLNVLNQFPVTVSGIEQNLQLVELARAQGLNVWQRFTETEQTILDLSEQKKFDVFLSFNFLEHQPDPGTMLRCIYHNLNEEGMGLLTVPSLEYILKYNGYYELIRDHLAYYTFDTLKCLLERNGFEVLEEEMINRDTLSVVVRKNSSKFSACLPDHKVVIDAERLKHSRDIINREIHELLDKLGQEGRKIAMWGAGHQGFTLAATTVLKHRVAYIVDSAPFKQGRYAPASHLPIVAPEYFEQDPVSAILITAPGYTEEIAERVREQYGDQVEIYTLRSDHLERIK